jgi:site-specific DNA recombinase
MTATASAIGALGVYGRVSVLKETAAREDRPNVETSVGRQFRDCLDYAQRQGWPVARTYADEGISAFSGRTRPEFEKLIRDVDAGVLDGVLCWKLDRLCRRPRDLERLWEVCERRGARLISLNEMFDSSTPSGQFVIRIMVGMAQMESENTRLRVKSHMQAAARVGHPHTPRRAFGFEDKGLDQRPAEVRLLLELVERIEAGGSLTGVAHDWTRRGVPTMRGGPRWTPTTLRQILRAARIAGLREYRPRDRDGRRPRTHPDPSELYPGSWQPIISAERWHRLCEILDDPARRTTPGPTRVHLLSGMIVCGLCGAKAYGGIGRQGHGQERVYRCREIYGGCGRMHRRADEVEAWTSRLVVDLLNDEALWTKLAGAEQRNDRERKLHADRQAFKADLDRIEADYPRRIGAGEMRRAKARITPQLERIDRELARAPARPAATVTRGQALEQGMGTAEHQNLSRLWPLGERRRVVGMVLAHVKVLPTSRGRLPFDPHSIEPVWADDVDAELAGAVWKRLLATWHPSPNRCQVDGCQGDHYARGWCEAHYAQWRRRGRITATRRRCAVRGCGAQFTPKTYKSRFCPAHSRGRASRPATR